MVLHSMLSGSPVFLVALSVVVLVAYGVGTLTSACLRRLRRR